MTNIRYGFGSSYGPTVCTTTFFRVINVKWDIQITRHKKHMKTKITLFATYVSKVSTTSAIWEIIKYYMNRCHMKKGTVRHQIRLDRDHTLAFTFNFMYFFVFKKPCKAKSRCMKLGGEKCSFGGYQENTQIMWEFFKLRQWWCATIQASTLWDFEHSCQYINIFSIHASIYLYSWYIMLLMIMVKMMRMLRVTV